MISTGLPDPLEPKGARGAHRGADLPGPDHCGPDCLGVFGRGHHSRWDLGYPVLSS